MNENTARKQVTTARPDTVAPGSAARERPGLARVSFSAVQQQIQKGKKDGRMSRRQTDVRPSRRPAKEPEAMPKRTDSKFIPCVARHFFQRAVSYGSALESKFASLKTQLDEYEGTQVPEVQELLGEIERSLVPVQENVMKLARVLNDRSSKPEAF